MGPLLTEPEVCVRAPRSSNALKVDLLCARTSKFEPVVHLGVTHVLDELRVRSQMELNFGPPEQLQPLQQHQQHTQTSMQTR